MKTISLITFVACVAASALMSSCSNEENAATNEENAATNGQLTAFTGGIVTEAPMTRVQLGASKSSTVAQGFLTRTSMKHSKIGGGGTFFWEVGDFICVPDDNNNICESQSNITPKIARNTFLVNGAYGANSSYDVYYHGTNSGTDHLEVVIPATQTQAVFNDTKHFGASGDCGVAKATKNTEAGASGYKFNLEHKAAYLCFLPYTAKEQREKYKIKSIEVTSDKNIAGNYRLFDGCLSGEGSSKTITLRVGEHGLLLANKNVDEPRIANSLYMVVAPGEHTLKVKYTLIDTKANKIRTLTKSYKPCTLEANTIYDIPANLNMATTVEFPGLYSGHNYYMWDAKENYWSGHEWDTTNPWQPAANKVENGNYPKSNADASRWYHEGEGAFEASVNPLFSLLPNANEMAWYVMRGDPHWDNTTQWKAFGEKHTGGIWLKKLSVIAHESKKTLSDLKKTDCNGYDMHTTARSYDNSLKSGKPNNSEISNYFFLPALGFYNKYRNGRLSDFGSEGFYWSSIALPGNFVVAYVLHFNSSRVKVSGQYRSSGFVAQPFE